MSAAGQGDVPHPPRVREPAGAPTLRPGSVVRDVASGETTTYDAWLARCASSENRTHEECVEQLMNAIARGDVVVVDDGGSRG